MTTVTKEVLAVVAQAVFGPGTKFDALTPRERQAVSALAVSEAKRAELEAEIESRDADAQDRADWYDERRREVAVEVAKRKEAEAILEAMVCAVCKSNRASDGAGEFVCLPCAGRSVRSA